MLGVVLALASGCAETPEEKKSEGELLRELLQTGLDESIIYSTSILFNQSGADFTRTVDSIKRAFVNPLFRTEEEEAGAIGDLACRAGVYDTLFGTITYMVGITPQTFAYSKLTFGGGAKFIKIGTGSGHDNPWWLWRMQYRRGTQAVAESPRITTMTLSKSGSPTYSISTVDTVRVNRDSVLTFDSTEGTLDIALASQKADDSFFVTYPGVAGLETIAMLHDRTTADSLKHTAQVQVQSNRRYELLCVQGFKARFFEQTGLVGGQASTIHTAVLAFRNVP